MQPFYNEQQQLLASTTREFAQNDLAPLADEVDTTEQFPKKQFDALAELGLTGLLIPPRTRRRRHGIPRLHGRP